MAATYTATSLSDPVNAAILAVSEDSLQGFQEDPFGEVASRSGVASADVIVRVSAMLEAGTIRRVRQTLQSTRLAAGGLVAWSLPEARLPAAFDYMYLGDPFSGHVVMRSTDPEMPGARYRLWSTVKVPQGYSLARHCELLAKRVGAEAYRVMPARCLFTLGVGHIRRRGMEPGERTDVAATPSVPQLVRLDEKQWRVLAALKRDFSPQEIVRDLWCSRAEAACLPLDEFLDTARSLDDLGLLGRFSTFLEHVKPLADGSRVTRYNALFHWTVPLGREMDAGREIGRHMVMTHAYWREGGPEFGNVNVMGVAHGLDKPLLLAHKAAIDSHLADAGIDVGYTNVFWGGRSEIKPSEILPAAYEEWCRRTGTDPESMREEA